MYASFCIRFFFNSSDVFVESAFNSLFDWYINLLRFLAYCSAVNRCDRLIWFIYFFSYVQHSFLFTYCITLEFCFISQFYWLILKLYTYSNMICFVKYFLWIIFFVITHTITYIITFYGKLSFILTPKKMMNFIASLCAISYCIPFRYSLHFKSKRFFHVVVEILLRSYALNLIDFPFFIFTF